ncbi:MAG: hypothetical protein L3J13_06730 [Devosiaceae bacterium]|nr:hypothetical protein [Devosiaceae bacterium]
MRDAYLSPLNTHTGFWFGASTIQSIMHLMVAFVVLLLAIACFVISTLLGVIATFFMTLLLCLMLPAATPALLIVAFMFQNMAIAIFIPLMGDTGGFDAVRGVNFVMLLSALGAFTLAAFLHTDRLPYQTRRWILLVLAVIGLVTFYLVLGAVRGDMKDAVIYFRNTLTPLACFAIGLTAASLYKIQLTKVLLWLGLGAAAYGYAEMFFTFEFLALFNGDDYFRLRLAGQIESGYWDRILLQTGFVLRSLEDVMMVPFLNMAIFEEVFPSVFRLSGPNFHPISYAYALAIISAWMIFSRQTWFLIFTIPLLLVIGSKGALILLICAIAMKIGVSLIGLRFTVLSFVIVLFIYISAAIIVGRANGDYHVLGLLAGIRDFIRNPFGQGLGFGGNLSSSIKSVLDWSRAQQQGIADIPVESALGVMLYQMGVGAIVYFSLLIGIAKKCYEAYKQTSSPVFLFGLATIGAISTNAILQEEAVYSPLALGLTLLLVGTSLGNFWQQTNPAKTANARFTHE